MKSPVHVSYPLLMMGGDVGDIEGHALLAGRGSGGGGGGGESCPSSSEELSSVKSITSTFLLLLPSLPPWLDDEELRWSEPADVRHEPWEQQRQSSTVFVRSCLKQSTAKQCDHAQKDTHTSPLLSYEIQELCYYGDKLFTQWPYDGCFT